MYVLLRGKPEETRNREEGKIEELLTRGVERIYPSREFLEKRLRSGEKLTIYLGVDPTGPTLHIGHAIPLMKLKQFQELGCKIILLVGDFTGMIGDPTGKNAARKPLKRSEVLSNAKSYKKQASRLIRFSGKNPAELRYNSEWLDKLSFSDFQQLASLTTVEQLVKRDMFEERRKAGKPIYLHEFVYPLLQGYDSVKLKTDGEVGGNDQTFNMLVGRDLVRALKKKEKFVVVTKLLIDSAGNKMGKTESNMIAFSDSPDEIFGKVMSWPDGAIISGFELCTEAQISEIQNAEKNLAEGANPKEVKLKLAEAVAALLCGEEEAKKARSVFIAAFTEGKPEKFVEVCLSGKDASETFVLRGIVSSKSDLRRLLAEGAVTNLDTNEKMSEKFLKSAPAGKYRVGKHRFVRIT